MWWPLRTTEVRPTHGLARGEGSATGLTGGDEISVTLTLNTAPREVSMPDDFAAALDRASTTRAFFEGCPTASSAFTWTTSTAPSQPTPDSVGSTRPSSSSAPANSASGARPARPRLKLSRNGPAACRAASVVVSVMQPQRGWCGGRWWRGGAHDGGGSTGSLFRCRFVRRCRRVGRGRRRVVRTWRGIRWLRIDLSDEQPWPVFGGERRVGVTVRTGGWRRRWM